MKVLITGNTNVVVPADFLTKFFTALNFAKVDLNDVSRLHRLSRPGFEHTAFKLIDSWGEIAGSRVPVSNHTPLGSLGGKNARPVMHGEVITKDVLDLALVFVDSALDEHSTNVVYWLDKRDIPYYIVTIGGNHEKVYITSHGFAAETQREDLS